MIVLTELSLGEQWLAHRNLRAWTSSTFADAAACSAAI